MKRWALWLIIPGFLLAGCVDPQRPGSAFTGEDLRDFANGLMVFGDQPNDRIVVGHSVGEFRLDLPYATDWIFEPTDPDRPLHASSQSRGLTVTVELHQPGRRIDPLRYLRDDILAGKVADFRQQSAAEPHNVRVSDHRGHPVLEYDLEINDMAADGGELTVLRHNLWAIRQRDSDDVVINLHISTTVPVPRARDADLLQLQDQVAQMMGAGFEVRPR